MRAEARGDYTSRARRREAGVSLETQAAHAVLRAADVVCACVGAGDDLLEGFRSSGAWMTAQCPSGGAHPGVEGVDVRARRRRRAAPPTVTSMDACTPACSRCSSAWSAWASCPTSWTGSTAHPALAEFRRPDSTAGASRPTPPADRPPPPGAPWARRDAGVDARPRSNSNAWSPYPVLFVEVDGGRETREKDGLKRRQPGGRRARRWRRRRRCWRRPRTETRRIESRISRAISGSSRRTPRRRA